VDVSLL